jgi:hypothetical protein
VRDAYRSPFPAPAADVYILGAHPEDSGQRRAVLRLTFEAETPADLDAQVRSYINGSGGAVATPLRQTHAGGSGPSARSNDEYRRAIRAIPRGKVASYGTVSEVVRGDTDGSQHVAGLAAARRSKR